MKTKLRPASLKARVLLKKLQALADRGVDGEKLAAQRKLARLKAQFDFSGPDPEEALNLFSGRFSHSATARRICRFGADEFDIANSVKWAIESATNIPCIFRHGDLLAEATPGSVNRLKEIAAQIAGSFRALLEQFRTVDGVDAKDRNVFTMGLYDSMMNETRNAGQRLPSRAEAFQKRKGKSRKPPAPAASGLHFHPYTLAVSLGRQIRFSAPLEQIAAELTAATQKHLAPPSEPAATGKGSV